MTRLTADWLARADLAALVAALGPGRARYVGGAVRDTLLGLPVKDIDMATVLAPDATMARLRTAGVRVVPTGLAHGTVTAVLDGGPVEITTLRRDIDTDGRHATVAFSDNWREDAARRDFTINALYADPITGEVTDFFAGLADLTVPRVRFINDPRQRIREDHLRILRYFRFQARFGATPDADADAACAELAPTLRGLSRERVAGELLALLALPDPAPTLARMAALGVLREVLPEAGDLAPLDAVIAAEAAAAMAPAPIRRLAALLPTDPAQAEQVAARLRLSGAQRKRLALAAARTGDAGDPRALAWAIGVEAAADRLLLAGGSVATLDGWTPPVFPLKGGEIVARGVKAGPAVARVLRQVEAAWVAEGFPDAARVEALLGEALKREG